MKKHFGVIFWAGYMLFFAIPFPMLLYYSINSEFDVSTLKDKNPYLALSFLVLSILLWFILLIGYFQKWIVNVVIAKRNLEKIKTNGVQREAKIIHAEKISKPNSKFNTYELDLLFKNLSDAEITHKTILTDIKPHERRFEAGKKLSILLNTEMKQEPYFVVSNTNAAINLLSLFIRSISWIILTTAVIGYYIFSYQFESYGMGWRFICIGHPLLICPVSLLFFRYMVKFINGKLTGLSDDSVLIKFKGIKTQARIVNVSQTGTYINERPMMRFELEFTDNNHRIQKGVLNKVIGFLELDFTKQQYADIFYLPEDPAKIVFANDLKNLS